MKFILILLAVGLVDCYEQVSLFKTVFEKLHQEPKVPSVKYRNNIDVKYIRQPLDNFNENDNRTWHMRYMLNDYYFKEGGPIFIFVGGEWEITDEFLRGGHMFDMAKSLNGYMFYTEHRYYGRSQPFRTLELENLQYLNAKQALADLAHFIRTVKATVPELKNAKVILVGASYSGALATWFNRVYPDLVDGTWATGASLNAQLEFVEFKEAAGNAIRDVGGQACYNRIKNAIAILEEEIDNHKLDTMKKFINICPGFDTHNKNDVMWVFRTFSNYFGGMVQVNMDIKEICSEIMSAPTDIEGVGNYLQKFLSQGDKCYSVTYQSDVKEFQKLPVAGIIRPWWYQTCNEFGYYSTSGNGNHPFGMKFPLEIDLVLCKDAYGPMYTKEAMEQKIAETIEYFGGLNPQVKNIFFTHGELDPWRPVGISCDGDCGRVISRYSHCNDLESASSNDSQAMLEAKQKIFEMVQKWVKG